MTENEAKLIIERKSSIPMENETFEEICEAYDIATQALEEIQQYRAIGTVEKLKSMKENGAFSGVELAQICAMQSKLREYQAIGTIEEFKALKEKSVAKKPIDKIMYLECPACGDVGILDCGYCSVCGQKLDWSE